jgi:hypothetical protein
VFQCFLCQENFFFFFFFFSSHSIHHRQKQYEKLNANSPPTKAQSNFPIVSHPKKEGKKESQERTSHQNKERNAHTTQLSENVSFLTHQR